MSRLILAKFKHTTDDLIHSLYSITHTECTVMCLALRQTWDCALIRASFCTSNVTTSNWPASEAMCSAVLPFCSHTNTHNTLLTCSIHTHTNSYLFFIG